MGSPWLGPDLTRTGSVNIHELTRSHHGVFTDSCSRKVSVTIFRKPNESHQDVLQNLSWTMVSASIVKESIEAPHEDLRSEARGILLSLVPSTCEEIWKFT